MKQVAARLLAVGFYGALVLAVALPIVLDVDRRQFVMDNAELEGMQWVHVVRVGDVGWTDAISGELDAGHVAEFIRRNGLKPESGADEWWIRAGGGPFAGWERHWPANPRFYGRVRPRSNSTCHYGCNVFCLVDSLTGRIWVAVEMPDFAGD